MKVLFIGGTGRLSKDVVYESINKNWEVTLITRGDPTKKIFVPEKATMIYADVNNSDDCIEKLKGKQFDVVVDFLTYNISQLKNTLKIIDGKYKQYIFISSAVIYKTVEASVAITEETPLDCDNEWIYVVNKIKCEKYLDEYFSHSKSKYTIIRPYVTYGNTRVPYPIVPDNNLEWTLVNRMIFEKPIPVFNNGQTVTTLTHTKDFAKGLVGSFKNEKAYNQTFHITSNENVTHHMVLDYIAKAAGKKVITQNVEIDVLYKYRLIYDKMDKCIFDNTKINSINPKFKCEISCEEGIKDMFEFYQKNTMFQLIDYYWDGKLDRLCYKFGAKKFQKGYIPTLKYKVLYCCGRFSILDLIYSLYKKLNK